MSKKILTLLLFSLVLSSAVLAREAKIIFQQTNGQPYLISQELMRDSEEFRLIKLNIKAEMSSTARLMWANSYDPQFNQNKSVWFSVRRGTHNYFIAPKHHSPNWIGWVKGLLVYPETSIEINQAELSTGNLLTTIRAGWQEFWGPTGRLVIGSTINTMKSPYLFGRSINVYIYWILSLLLIGLAVWKYQDISEIAKYIFAALLIFWFLLEISSFISYTGWFKNDWKYVGKSYREKLVLANTGDFYPFIEFCEKNIPATAKIDLRIPPLYNDIKARYYLYPRQTSTTESDYLVVYDLNVEPTIAKSFLQYKQFRNNAYILKRSHI
ncbi:MAG: hypothetical protein ABIE84_01870 [bacterium]